MSKIRPSFVADGHGEAIQGVLKPTVAQKMTLSGLPNARTSVDLTTMIVEVTPTVACNFDIGDASIVAKSGEGFYLAANVPQLFNVGEHTRIGAQASVSGEIGTLFITELS